MPEIAKEVVVALVVKSLGRVEVAVVVAKIFPTVSCVPVAERAPEELEVMMELIGYVPVLVKKPASLLNQESLTDDDAIVFTCPLVPVYAKP